MVVKSTVSLQTLGRVPVVTKAISVVGVKVDQTLVLVLSCSRMHVIAQPDQVMVFVAAGLTGLMIIGVEAAGMLKV